MNEWYIILEKGSSVECGCSDKLWLARLFVIQRRYYCRSKEFTINIQKHKKKEKFGFKLKPTYLTYVSGYAITNHEKEFLDYRLSFNNHSVKKSKKKNIEEKGVTKNLLLQKIAMNSPEVKETLFEKEFFDSLI